MAKPKPKAKAKRRARPKAAADTRQPVERLIEALYSLVCERGWRDLPLRDVAEKAAVPLAEAIRIAPTKIAIVALDLGRLADAVGERAAPDDKLPTRDRVFDAAMDIFDTLGPWRESMAPTIRALAHEPLALLELHPAIRRLSALTLERAGLSTDGLEGQARVAGFALILVRTLRIFAGDEAGLGKTMAALDRSLREAERWLGRLGLKRKGGRDERSE